MRRLALLACFAFAACRSNWPDLRLTFDDSGQRVTISQTSTLSGSAARDDVVAGRDPWSVRFQHAGPQRDSVTFERAKGELETVEHSATIDADDLQKFFFDLPVTTTVLHGEGWIELSIYPGTSDRATRQEREEYEKEMQAGAHLIVRYFRAMRVLYAYLDRHPQRAAGVFDQLARDDDDPRPPVVTKFEMGLIRTARDRIGAVRDFDWAPLAQRADLVENPIPAVIKVRVPTKPLIVEGFERQGDDLVVRPRTLFDAMSELEGRWLSPDPLAMGLRTDKVDDVIAAMTTSPRHAEPVVTAEDVVAAVREKMHLLPRYRVRFVVR